MQIITFAVISVLSLLLVRPTLLRKLHKPNRERLSNAEAMIGQQGRVSEAIEAGETLWATLSRHDRERYIKDPDGCIYVAEVPIVWDYDDEEYVVANYDCSPIWSAF